MIRKALYDLFSCDFELEVLAGDELLEYERDSQEPSPYPEMEGYTFDHFVVGPSNKFAHAAAIAVANNPGKVYNPLFIYGNSGLGKTHLLLAIGEKILTTTPNFKIAYLKGDDFTNELIHSVMTGTSREFREKYRNIDLLLMDDIQFIAGKRSTQEETFHTFNSIYEAGHQIVLTADRPPIDMAQLDDRLRTRIEGGLMADVQPPDIETRTAIILNKAAQLGLVLPKRSGELHRREHNQQRPPDRGRCKAPDGLQGDYERHHHDKRRQARHKGRHQGGQLYTHAGNNY